MTGKSSRKRFKEKVIAKLFSEADEDIYDQDDATSGNSTEEDCTTAASSASLVSSEVQVRDVPFYGVHCSFPGQKEKCVISNINVIGASESDSCEGESENCVPRKRRRRRKGHHNSDKTGQEVTPAASDTPPTLESACNTTITSSMASSSLTKNQKRKVKKKRRDKEKKAQSSSSIEFIYDSWKTGSKTQICQD